MTIRAKMKVEQKIQTTYGHGVKLTAVYGDSPENKAFFAATPSGNVEMAMVKPEVAAAFELGKEYYVDFTPAE